MAHRTPQGRTTRPADPSAEDPGTAHVSVMLAGGGAVLATAGALLFAMAYAIGGEDATSDNWVGVLTVVALLGAAMGSFAGFALAVVARARHRRWARAWLPLSVFPVIVALVVLGELLWWE